MKPMQILLPIVWVTAGVTAIAAIGKNAAAQSPNHKLFYPYHGEEDHGGVMGASAIRTSKSSGLLTDAHPTAAVDAAAQLPCWMTPLGLFKAGISQTISVPASCVVPKSVAAKQWMGRDVPITTKDLTISQFNTTVTETSTTTQTVIAQTIVTIFKQDPHGPDFAVRLPDEAATETAWNIVTVQETVTAAAAGTTTVLVDGPPPNEDTGLMLSTVSPASGVLVTTLVVQTTVIQTVTAGTHQVLWTSTLVISGQVSATDTANSNTRATEMSTGHATESGTSASTTTTEALLATPTTSFDTSAALNSLLSSITKIPPPPSALTPQHPGNLPSAAQSMTTALKSGRARSCGSDPATFFTVLIAVGGCLTVVVFL